MPNVGLLLMILAIDRATSRSSCCHVTSWRVQSLGYRSCDGHRRGAAYPSPSCISYVLQYGSPSNPLLLIQSNTNSNRMVVLAFYNLKRERAQSPLVPFLLSAAMDFVSRKLSMSAAESVHNVPLNTRELEELGRRRSLWAYYLLRSPLYDKIARYIDALVLLARERALVLI